jgi:glyoxylase I family protein
MTIKRIHHVALICSNYEKSKDFYVNALGFTVKAEHYRKERNSWKLDLEVAGEYQIELFSFDGCPERRSYPESLGLRHLAFAVEDVELAAAELRGRGIATEAVRVDEYTGRKFVFFMDPDGQPLEFYEDNPAVMHRWGNHGLFRMERRVFYRRG